ncbi:MAG: hypothetical protein ACOCP8_00585 [archaeon]
MNEKQRITKEILIEDVLDALDNFTITENNPYKNFNKDFVKELEEDIKNIMGGIDFYIKYSFDKKNTACLAIFIKEDGSFAASIITHVIKENLLRAITNKEESFLINTLNPVFVKVVKKIDKRFKEGA